MPARPHCWRLCVPSAQRQPHNCGGAGPTLPGHFRPHTPSGTLPPHAPKSLFGCLGAKIPPTDPKCRARNQRTTFLFYWWTGRDSNPRPRHYEDKAHQERLLNSDTQRTTAPDMSVCGPLQSRHLRYASANFPSNTRGPRTRASLPGRSSRPPIRGDTSAVFLHRLRCVGCLKQLPKPMC